LQDGCESSDFERLRFQIEALLGAACANMTLTIAVVAVLVFGTTILAYWSELLRGVEDVGFVGASLRAERKRRRGI
jgi:rhomboid protease GluP